MKKRIIISKDNNTYYYTISVKINDKWKIVESKSDIDSINQVLDIEINNIHFFNNLLIVKAKEDLIIINNYSQLSKDHLFNQFNEKIRQITINKDLIKKKKKLQKKSNHRKAIISRKALCCAIIAGSILVSPIFTGKALNSSKPNFSQEHTVMVDTRKTIQEVKSKEIISINKKKEIIEEPKLSEEEEYFIKKIKEYSSMYFIEYDRALTLIKEKEDIIKNEYANQEVGIIRILAEEFYKDNTIDKTPIISNMSTLEREKLLTNFANVHNIKDIDTLSTLLAVYRLETGRGTSEACVYKNNFGGLRTRNSKTGKYYIMAFKTPEIGAEALVKNFIRIKGLASNSKNYNPNHSLEQNMNPIYCGEPSWSSKVAELKQEVVQDYDLLEYITTEKPKLLIK